MTLFGKRGAACSRLSAVAIVLAACCAGESRGDFTVESVVDGLNQPMYVTQAPGDNTSLYVVERNDGGQQLGRIRKLDLQSGALSTFLDVTGDIVSDGGLLSMTFHPEFETNGLFYVVSNNGGVNGLDEYGVVGGTPQHQRRLIEYQNLNNVFHTMNQAFFRPGGDSNELYVTTGDGGTQANEGSFDPDLIEDSTSPYGKIMKVDLAHDFTSPADGTGPGVSLVAKGIRNPYRASFDRQTGDFYFGDVGFTAVESIDFIPADYFPVVDPGFGVLDFGWTDREGTIATVNSSAGGPGSPGDIDPIFDYAHSGQPLPHESLIHGGGSVTGGYVYRGPVSELQGRYFFSDFLNGSVYSGEFDRTTDPADFDGTNLADLTDHTDDFESVLGNGALRFVTSFGEDNAGNLYIVKFGDSFFPDLGEGQVFRVSPVLSENFVLEVDRETGAISLSNATGEAVEFTSLTLGSARGAIDPDALTPITGNYDNGGVVDDDPWEVTSEAGSHTLFSEASTGDGGALGGGEEVVLSPAGGWLPSPDEDLFASVLLGDGSVLNATVSFTGNGGSPFMRSDLDFSGDIGLDDWSVFVENSFTDLEGLSSAQAYARGDLDGDSDNDYADFLLFKADFNAANGAGAFEAAVRAVPEPGSFALVGACVVAATAGRKRRRFALSAGCCECKSTRFPGVQPMLIWEDD